jgi:hypothetical protein
MYFENNDQSIHLWRGSLNDWTTYAYFFHEFLHFVGVRIDPVYHANPDYQNFVEVDSVYACTYSVFPEMARGALLIDLNRLPPARAKCALAETETTTR